MLHLLLLCLWSELAGVTLGDSENKDCSVELFIDSAGDETHNISSPGYPDSTYPPGTSYTWCISSPENTFLILICDIFDIPKSADCEKNALTVQTGEDVKRSYCGTETFQVESDANSMVVTLHSSKRSRGGNFSCQIKSMTEEKYNLRAVIYQNCDCGYTPYRMRIVGGEETKVNEFPFMAGILKRDRGAVIQCGAAIISQNFVMTAEHCVIGSEPEDTAIVVGEHDVTKSSDTSATQVIRAKRIVHYPYYRKEERQYDIALIELVSSLTYTNRVGPICLPFRSREWNLTGRTVYFMGWGTTEFGGPRSKVLQKTSVNIVNINDCIKAYGDVILPYYQLCAFRYGSDACQYDSGGPMVYYNPDSMRYEIVGIVSYGQGCASDKPSVNTYVAPFLQWILDNTETEIYCYK